MRTDGDDVPGVVAKSVLANPPSVTAVVAPAGSGKTTFVRRSLELADVPHRWVTIPDSAMAQEILHEVAGDTPSLVVIDDAHHLPHVPECRAAIDRALDDGWRFVFIGRSEPPTALWRRLGRGEGQLIGFEQLLLSRLDVEAMASARDLSVSAPDLDELFRLTRGWPALVEIVLDAIARHPDRGASMHLPIEDAGTYVRAEVLAPMPEDLRTLCARLAHLGVFTPDMIRATLDLDTADAFEQSWRPRSMLVRCAPGPMSPAAPASGVDSLMFPPILEAELRRDRTAPDPDTVTCIHKRASHWHESRNEWDRALAHRLEVDPADAVRRLGRLTSALEPLGRSDDALQWFRQLPQRLRKEPAAVSALALALVQAGLAEEAAQLIEQIDTTTWVSVDRAEIAMIDALVSRVLMRNDDSVRAAQRSLALVRTDPGSATSPARLAYLRVMAIEQLRDVALWNGDPATVRSLMDEMEQDVIRSGLQLSLVHSTAITAMAALDSGDLPLAEEKAGVALRLAERRGFDDTHIVAEARFVQAAIAAEHGRPEAVDELIATRALARDGLFPTTRLRVELLLAPQLARLGRHEEAWATIEDLGTEARRSGDRHLRARVEAASGLTALESGDLTAVRASSRRLRNVSAPPDVVRTRLHLASSLGDDPSPAESHEHQSPAHESVDRVVALLVASRSRIRTDPDRAAAELISALRLAERCDLWLTVVPHLDRSGPLLSALREGADITRGPSPSYVRRIAAVITESSRQVSVLSARETEIAQYLPTRKTNVQIAAELFISENTVKTHLRHIYQKLGVEQRDDAVRRLTELGLLGGGGGGAPPPPPHTHMQGAPPPRPRGHQ
ncbi:LuxR C-terminal-related transcriptional regulator, partial [Gordonia sp. NPDC058843]|uniref:LuxR C-terminal-related transcriptional regulator n=1 Tax=Gordonia sp. NPDC058843 TaxID=3346648 RepID=UPI0036CB8032